MKIIRIEYASKEYEQELKLRDDILRKPLGMDLYSEDLNKEKDDIHIGAFLTGELIGVLVLSDIGGGAARMRQVAVREDWQHQGIGKKLAEHFEKTAKDKGFSKIYLHARKTAEEFYIKLGYKAVGEEFKEVGIAHQAMEKLI